MNTEKLNNQMFGARKNYVKPVLLVGLFITTLVILLALGIKSSHAMSTARFAACQNVLSIVATPHNPVGNNPHPACVPYAKGTDKQAKHTVKDNAPVVQDNTKVTLDTGTTPNVPDENNTTPIVDDTESNDTPVVTAPVQGNPGNDKPVGNAGEKCEKGMCENSDGQSGEHGNSDND
jgi:hypothetical protein